MQLVQPVLESAFLPSSGCLAIVVDGLSVRHECVVDDAIDFPMVGSLRLVADNAERELDPFLAVSAVLLDHPDLSGYRYGLQLFALIHVLPYLVLDGTVLW